MIEDDYAWHCPSCESNRYHCLCDVLKLNLTKKESGLIELIAMGQDDTELRSLGWTNRFNIIKEAWSQVSQNADNINTFDDIKEKS